MSIRTALLARLKKGLSDIVHVLPTSMGTKVVAVAVVFFSIAILFVWIIGKQGDGRPVSAITLGPPFRQTQKGPRIWREQKRWRLWEETLL